MKVVGYKFEIDGLGDVSVGVKVVIFLDDECLSMVVLVEVIIVIGNDGFINEDDIYSLLFVVVYDYSDFVLIFIIMCYEV